MNIKQVKELVELMRDNDLTEVEIEQEGMKIKLAKKLHGVIEQVVAPTMAMPQQAPQAQGTAPEAAKAEPEDNFKEVDSPMVGTFYRAPSPESDSFVEVGDVVKKGDVICIIEAMKLMNEIKAEFGGKIVAICVDNADAVEFGQALFKVEPA